MPWTEIGGIPSETSRFTTYSIEVNERGEMRCRCSSFINCYAPKTCKHIRSPRAQALLQAHYKKIGSGSIRMAGEPSYMSYTHDTAIYVPHDMRPWCAVSAADVTAAQLVIDAASSLLASPRSETRMRALRTAVGQCRR